MTGAGAIAGSVAGLVAVFVLGVVTRGGMAGGWAMLTIADSPALDIGAFVWAPVASTIVALAWPRAAERGGAGGESDALSPSRSSPRRRPRARR